MKPMRYVSLHHHSTFSFLDGFGLPESHVRRCTELDMGTLALTEHGNVASHVKLEIAATKQGVKPIFGCELYVVHDPKQRRKYHLTVLAENQEGYRNLLRLVSIGWANVFDRTPSNTMKEIYAHREGLIILSGCTGSQLACSLRGGKDVEQSAASYARAKDFAARCKRAFGDSYFLEVQAFPELEASCEINPAYQQLSQELGIHLVATGDVHYTQPNEGEMQQILHNVRGGTRKTMEEQARSWGYDVKLVPPLSDNYMYHKLRATGLSQTSAIAAIVNTEEIGQRCNVVLPKLPRLRFPLPPEFKTSQECWRAWLREGWHYRKIPRKPDLARYKEQLHHEMEVIEGKDFLDYFLAVSDIVKFAKDKAHCPVGPARGSAAASIVCYLLRITEVDPLRFPNMLFERFIDVTRMDLPDIDLDFDPKKRPLVRDYAQAVYGRESVGNIGTFTNYKAKLSLDDIARVYHIPKWEVDAVKGRLIERSSGDLRPSATIEDTVDRFKVVAEVFDRHPKLRKAMDLEGQVKGVGSHAAGLVVANGPLTDVTAVLTRKVAGVMTEVITADKKDAEYLNILKMDFLSLDTMSMIEECLRRIGKPLPWLYDIDLEDEEVIRGFKENDVVGIFQFDGKAMRPVNKEVSPDNFDQVADICALARPGPLHNGATAEYIEVKQGRKEPRSIHPMLDAICGSTYGQIVYQEQILRIVREIGDFDWTAASYIRKIISQKIGVQEFNRQYERFWQGAKSHGMTEEQARTIWDWCITAGTYAFNIAHSVSYGMLAWWTMYLKRYYPEEFYVSSLLSYGEDKQVSLLRDAVYHGVPVWAPDPLQSNENWEIAQGEVDEPNGESHTVAGIQAGFAQIPGIGESKAAAIVQLREEKQDEFKTWADLIKVKGIGERTIEPILAWLDQEDPLEITKLERVLNGVREQITGARLGSPWSRLPYPTHTSEQVPSTAQDKNENTEIVWLGFIKHRNLRDLFESHYSKTGEQLDPDDVRDPNLREWVVMYGEDDTEVITVTVDRWRYPSLRHEVWDLKLDHDVVLVKGWKYGIQARRAIYVRELWVIDPD